MKSKAIQEAVQAAYAANRDKPILAELSASQAVLESGLADGKPSGLVENANNYFGMKGEGTAGYVLMPTTEVVNGQKTTVMAKFRKYNTPEESFADWRKLMEKDRYKNVLAANSFGEAAEAVANSGYATDPEYAKKVRNSHKAFHALTAMDYASEGNYKDAAKYAFDAEEKSDSASNKFSSKNFKKIGKSRNPEQDEEDQSSFISNMMQENPIVGLFLMVVGMMTGLLDFNDMGKLTKDFNSLPEEEREKAINSLPEKQRIQYENIQKLQNLSSDLKSTTAGDRTAELAEKFVGTKEHGGENCGAIVALSGLEQGQPWCGGFAEYVFSQTMPNVYKGENFKSAASYKKYGEKYGAFHEKSNAYTPEAGDAILFTRDGGSGYHVGIVTSVHDGKIEYVSGNDGNKVDNDSFSISNPPNSLVGFSSSREIAAKRGINLENIATKEIDAKEVLSDAKQSVTKEDFPPKAVKDAVKQEKIPDGVSHSADSEPTKTASNDDKKSSAMVGFKKSVVSIKPEDADLTASLFPNLTAAGQFKGTQPVRG